MRETRRLPLNLLTALFMASALLSLTLPLAAGSFCNDPFPPCDPHNPTSSCYVPPPPDPRCEPRECDKCTKSPCYTGTGVYIASAEDLRLPTAGFPLKASRLYDSSHMIDGPTGLGWTSSFAAHLYYMTYLFAAPSTYQREADVTMPTGAGYRFVDTGAGFTPPAGRYDILVHNADGTFDLTLQRTLSVLHFGLDGSLLTATDDYGNKLTYVSDGNGRLQQVLDSGGSGRSFAVAWGADGRISSVQDSAGRAISYAYDNRGTMLSALDAVGRKTSYTYSQGRYVPLLGNVTDNWTRLVTYILYDAADRVSTYMEQGETYAYTYAYQGNKSQTSKTDAAGNAWIYIYGSGGLVTDDIPPPRSGAGTQHTDYYPDGSIQKVIDAVGVATYLTYDPLGNVLSLTQDYQGPSAVRYDFTYDPNFPGRVTSITPRNPGTGLTDPAWQAWRYDYLQAGDPAPGRLHHVFRVERDGATLDTMATYSYDSQGRVLSVTDADGATTSYGYDAQGNPASVTRPANNDAGVSLVTNYGYDAEGRVTTVTDAMGSQTSYIYDALGRLAIITSPPPTGGSQLNFTMSFSYDSFDTTSGLVFTTATDPNGNTTQEGYDAYGRLERNVDPLGAVTQYVYTRDRLTRLIDANGNAASYTYDTLKRLTSMTFPDGAIESYTYYGDGALDTTTDRKHQTISYAYDHRRRLTNKWYPNGGSIAYTYTGQSLAEVVDASVSPSETHTFIYDSGYRMVAETQGPRGTLNYTYTPGDRKESDSVVGGQSSTFSYYPDGSLSTIVWSPVAGNFKFVYDKGGRYQQIAFPNGQVRSYSYDAQGRPLEVSNVHPVSGILATYEYGYDIDNTTGQPGMLGVRSSMAAAVPVQGLSGALTKYYYDKNYQLIRTDYPQVAPFNGEVDQWTYDLIGNRLTSTINGQSQSYGYQKVGANPNNWKRLLSDGTSTYGLDANGNVLSINGSQGSQAFTWDYDNRAARRTGTDVTVSTYDYRSRHATLTRGGQTISYLYREDSPVQAAGAVSEAFVYGPLRDELLASYQGGVVYYAVVDDHDSVVALADAAGTIHYNASYDVWGSVRASGGDVQSEFGHIGRQADGGSFWLNDARYYSPSIGRFLQEDPGG